MIYVNVDKLKERLMKYLEVTIISYNALAELCNLRHQTLSRWAKGEKGLAAVSARKIDAYLSSKGF